MDGGVFPKGEYPLPGSIQGGNIYLSQATEHWRRKKKRVARTCPRRLSKSTQVAGTPNRTGIRLPPLGTAKMNWKERFLHDVPKKPQMLSSGHICLFTFYLMFLVHLKRQKNPTVVLSLKSLIWE